MKKIKKLVGEELINFSFWYDAKFLHYLPLDEDDWSIYDMMKWKVSNWGYRMGCYLQTKGD